MMREKKYRTGASASAPLRILSVLLLCALVVLAGALPALADETSGESTSQSEQSGEESSQSQESSQNGEEGSSQSQESTQSGEEESSQAEATATPAPVVVPEPTEAFYVYDEAEVISDETEQLILEKNKELNEKYGVQIVIMAVKSTGGASMKDYTTQVFQSWQIGGGNGNGLLLVLNLEENTYHTASGAGLGNLFTSENLKTLVDEQLEPDFGAGSYDAGVKKYFETAVSQVEEYAAANPGAIEPSEPEENGFVSFLKGLGIFLLILVCVLILLILAVYLRGQMVRKKRMEQRRRRAMQARANTGRGSGQGRSQSSGRLPDQLSSGYRSASSSKYDFDEFKPRK